MSIETTTESQPVTPAADPSKPPCPAPKRGYPLDRQQREPNPLVLTFPECIGAVKPVYVKRLLDAIEELDLGGPDEDE